LQLLSLARQMPEGEESIPLPYIGVERSSKFGEKADLARAAGERSAETRWVAGVRFWF